MILYRDRWRQRLPVLGPHPNRRQIRQGRRRGRGAEGGVLVEHRRVGHGLHVVLVPGGGCRGSGELLLAGPLVLGRAGVLHPAAGVLRGVVVLEAEEAVDGGGVGGDPARDAVEGAGDGAVERVDEPVLGLGGVVEEGAEGGGGLGLGGEEEEADPGGAGGGAGGGGGGGDAVVLVDEVVEVLVGGDGDERVEVLVGELVLEREGLAGEEGAGEPAVDVGKGRVAVDGHDPEIGRAHV